MRHFCRTLRATELLHHDHPAPGASVLLTASYRHPSFRTVSPFLHLRPLQVLYVHKVACPVVHISSLCHCRSWRKNNELSQYVLLRTLSV